MTTSQSILYYSAIDEQGNIVAAQFTTDPDFPVKPGLRLLPDDSNKYFDAVRGQKFIQLRRVEPVLPEHTEVMYEVDDLPLQTVFLHQRNERDTRLALCDWRVSADLWATYTDQQRKEWSDYRQALRDVTQQPGWPTDVDWPTEPSTFEIISI
jgi:hypothetical protein